MNHFSLHTISSISTVKDALIRLDKLAADAVLFVIDNSGKLLGAITDGDLRRGFIKGFGFDQPLLDFMQPNPKFIRWGEFSLTEIIELRDKNYLVLPVINEIDIVINVVNFRYQKSYLPIDAIIMAGGRGERLKPLTDNTPKPLLKVGEKPILEHNIDRLKDFGVDDIWISVKYLGEQIEDHFKDGSEKSIRIKYIHEDFPLGTAGAIALVNDLKHDTVLVMNSDLLTNIDFEDLFIFSQNQNADLTVACIPYQVNIPYAVMETDDLLVTGFKEKPTYTHYSNAGIYLMKRSVIENIPKGQYFNATDLMETIITKGGKVVAYPLIGYWLDIGKHDDFKKAQEDIQIVKF